MLALFILRTFFNSNPKVVATFKKDVTDRLQAQIPVLLVSHGFEAASILAVAKTAVQECNTITEMETVIRNMKNMV